MFTLLSATALSYTVHESQTVGGVMSYQANISWLCTDVPKVEVKPYEQGAISLADYSLTFIFEIFLFF